MAQLMLSIFGGRETSGVVELNRVSIELQLE
jgi:hypothetical protein